MPHRRHPHRPPCLWQAAPMAAEAALGLTEGSTRWVTEPLEPSEADDEGARHFRMGKVREQKVTQGLNVYDIHE